MTTYRQQGVGLVLENRFRSVTWNVFHGTDTAELDPVLAGLRARGVSLFHMQEAQGTDLTAWLDAAGLRSLSGGDCRMVWDPEQWTVIREDVVVLSSAAFYRRGSRKPARPQMPTVILSDPHGRTIMAGSYHLPAHVQPANAPERRRAVTAQAMSTLEVLAKNAHTAAVVFAGDDNVDEFRGHGAGTGMWSFMLERRTGLRQVRAPDPTHGVRRIDDFRYLPGRGVKHGNGWTAPGGGDHRLHGREWTWLV